MIKAQNVTKFYGKTQALKDVSIEIADGEFAVILGASGSGKSTLLNVLSGLERVDGGIVTADGENLSEKNEAERTDFRRRTVGFIFKQY